jgi:arylsulfatase A-like enzyme
MGLIEVCWAYLLPILIPVRIYVLPDSSIIRFFTLAVVLDTAFVLAAGVLLGLLISITRILSKRCRSFTHWPGLIQLLLLASILSFLYRGNLYRFVLLPQDTRRLPALIIGLLIIILISFISVWTISKLKNKYRHTALAVWLITAGLLLCGTIPPYRDYLSKNTLQIQPPPDIPANLPNVLLVTLDTLRADYLHCYGNPTVQTPVLDYLAADGILFEAAFAQAPYTTPSHCSIMTSTYMSQHGAFHGSAMKTGLPTIADILKACGYQTSAFVSCRMVRSGNSRLNQGFDYYEDSLSPHTSFFRHDECQYLLSINIISHLQQHQIPGHIVTARALKWLNKKRKDPFLCWLHYFDPHTPYDAPEPYKDMYAGKVDDSLPRVFDRTRYAGEVTYTDIQLGIIINALKEKKLYDDMLIIVTSDHGEAFGEKHGDITEFGHGQYLYDTTLHVPLIIKLPKQKTNAKRVSNVVQLIDIAPTIMEQVGIPNPKSFHGKSLLELVNKTTDHPFTETYAQTIPPTSLIYLHNDLNNLKKTQLHSIRTDMFKFINNASGDQRELYDIVSDPLETENLAAGRPESARKYDQKIRDELGDFIQTQTTPYDSDTIEQLKSLGYVE